MMIDIVRAVIMK